MKTNNINVNTNFNAKISTKLLKEIKDAGIYENAKPYIREIGELFPHSTIYTKNGFFKIEGENIDKYIARRRHNSENKLEKLELFDIQQLYNSLNWLDDIRIKN